MSVKVHEAFSLDSFQDRLLFFDDFHGDQLQDEWRTTGDAGGSAVVVDAQTGGIVRITTDTDNTDDWRIDWGLIRPLLASKKVTMEVRLKLNQITNILMRIALSNASGTEYIHFIFDTSFLTKWGIRNRSGGSGATFDTGVEEDTDYHIFRIEAFPTGEVHFYIDGTETDNSPIAGNIPAGYLEPYIVLRTLENDAKSMDIDYVYIRQER